MMLASITDPTPVNIAAFLGSFAFLLVCWNQTRKAIDREKDKPAPGEVQAQTALKYTTKEEFAAHVARNIYEHDQLSSKIGAVRDGVTQHLEGKIDGLINKLPEMEQRINECGEGRITKVHDRINEILKEVGVLTGRTERLDL